MARSAYSDVVYYSHDDAPGWCVEINLNPDNGRGEEVGDWTLVIGDMAYHTINRTMQRNLTRPTREHETTYDRCVNLARVLNETGYDEYEVASVIHEAAKHELNA